MVTRGVERRLISGDEVMKSGVVVVVVELGESEVRK
jgi:hypothetical protein